MNYENKIYFTIQVLMILLFTPVILMSLIVTFIFSSINSFFNSIQDEEDLNENKNK
jgi:hypothetical protein